MSVILQKIQNGVNNLAVSAHETVKKSGGKIEIVALLCIAAIAIVALSHFLPAVGITLLTVFLIGVWILLLALSKYGEKLQLEKLEAEQIELQENTFNVDMNTVTNGQTPVGLVENTR